MTEPVRDKVQAATFAFLPEAETARILLEQNGIESEARDSGIVNADPFLSHAVGGVKLLVRPEDLERAQALLENDAKERTADNAQECPKCEGRDIARNRVGWGTIVLCILSLGILYPFIYKHYRCRACGRTWSYFETH